MNAQLLDLIRKHPIPMLVSIVFFFAISVSYRVGVIMTAQPRDVICRPYILETEELLARVTKCERERAVMTQEAALGCIEREGSICDERIETVKEKIKALRCRICEQQ